MNAITHDIIQGSEDWQAFRLTHFGASEAAAMLGLSPNATRSELLRAKHTGMAREFSDWLQRKVLDKGHEAEAMARPHVERLIGQALYPVTMSDGKISASCDGLTIDDEIAFEHKQWSEALAASLQAGVLPQEHMPQCQQVLMVTGAQKLIFVCSDGTPDRMVHLYVYPDAALFQRLRDGWNQFAADLAAYKLPDAAEPALAGRAPETLPALRIELRGEVSASNLDEFRATALGAIRSVNRTLRTDQDFADAEKAVKWCADVEARLKAAKDHALSQTATIDALFKALDDIGAEARTVRLELDKLVTRRKVEVKEEAIVRHREMLNDHIAVVHAEIAPMRLPPSQIGADWAGAIKGLKSMASVEERLGVTLANAKIAADAAARHIRANAEAFREIAAGHETLFPDLGQLVHKPADDFTATMHTRIAQHKAAEQARAEAARKRAEEEEQRRAAKAAEDAQAKAELLAAEQQRIAQQQAAAPAVAVPPPATPTGWHAPAAAARTSPAVEEPATLRLGDICARLGITMTAAFVADTLRCPPEKNDGRAQLYRASDFDRICIALRRHVASVQERHQTATADA